MSKAPTLTIICDKNGVSVSATCSCGYEIPQGDPRVTGREKSRKWFESGFKIHVREQHSGAHLIDGGHLKRCSVCGYPFPLNVEPSLERAFADHLLKAHKPGQTTEDVNQAAARIVKETTEDK